MKKLPFGIVLSYLAIYIVWGSTYLAIKWGVETLPPFYLVSFRFLFGGLLFLITALVSGQLKSFPKPKEILSAVFLGTFLLLLGNGLISWAETRVDSYLAAVIISCTPFCVAFFNRIFFKQNLLLSRLAGMILGVCGVALILYNGNSGMHFSPYIGLIFCGFLCWSFATIMGHKLPSHENNLINSGMQMLFVGLAALVLSLFIYKPLPQILPMVTVKSWLGLAYLAVLGAAAFYAYNYLLKREPSIRISSYSIINPLIAVILGLVLGAEKPQPLLMIGMPVILAGMVLMLYGERIKNAVFNKKMEG